jgi:hypothetical protein
MTGEGKAVSTRQYESRLRDWNSTAQVRAGARRCIAAEEVSDKLFFSPRLVPITDHRLVQDLGPPVLREILIQHLYGYLEFTAQFEAEVVNSATKAIARRKAGFDLPEEMVRDAYRIYCDEGYHSVLSADLKHQVEQVTGIPAVHYDFDHFLERLERVQDAVPPEMKELARLFVAILFETLISATLNRIPKDERVVTAVREMIRDHAEDEARHHFYFASLMDFIWPRLSRREQAFIGPLLPHMIIKCLEPDLSAIRRRLSKFGLAPGDVDQIVEESYAYADVISGIRKTARATMNILERNGLFQDARTLEVFRETQLLT